MLVLSDSQNFDHLHCLFYFDTNCTLLSTSVQLNEASGSPTEIQKTYNSQGEQTRLFSKTRQVLPKLRRVKNIQTKFDDHYLKLFSKHL